MKKLAILSLVLVILVMVAPVAAQEEAEPPHDEHLILLQVGTPSQLPAGRIAGLSQSGRLISS